MRLYYQAGDRTTALRQYERCATAMAKEFNVPPSRETVALYHQVRGDRLGSAPDIAAPDIAAPDVAGGGGEVLRGLQASLDHIQASITALQGQVQQHLAPVGQMQEAG
jgi:hypothetical protein